MKFDKSLQSKYPLSPKEFEELEEYNNLELVKLNMQLCLKTIKDIIQRSPSPNESSISFNNGTLLSSLWCYVVVNYYICFNTGTFQLKPNIFNDKNFFSENAEETHKKLKNARNKHFAHQTPSSSKLIYTFPVLNPTNNIKDQKIIGVFSVVGKQEDYTDFSNNKTKFKIHFEELKNYVQEKQNLLLNKIIEKANINKQFLKKAYELSGDIKIVPSKGTHINFINDA